MYEIQVDTIHKTSGDPFQCTVYLSNTHRNVREIFLKSVTLPIGFYNIRVPYNTVTIDGSVYTLSPGNYPDQPSITSNLNAASTGVGSFSYQSNVNKYTFTSGGGSKTITTSSPYLWSGPTFGGVQNNTSINISPPSLGSLIGFSNAQSGSTIVATNAFQVPTDLYLKLYIPNIGTSSLENSMSTFTIPLDGTPNGSVMYWNPPVPPSVVVTDKSVKIDKITISVIDRYGQQVINNGIDWSFTLGFCSDT